ncbi:MAG: DUF692 family multinuclear iron-containing protein [Nitrospiraceae bacterium]
MIHVQKYSKMVDVQSEFEERIKRIPIHGLGLSVDVYTPDLFDLVETLSDDGVEVDYFEIFQAPLTALRCVKFRLPDRRLAYHGEGLWITQPEFCAEQRHRNTLAEVSVQLHALDSAWLNLECATKQMSGYSFGTYLPPLYTELGARMAAENLREAQQLIDREFRTLDVPAPLLLVEMPPLTYFAYGSLSIPSFYERITREAACGLVLDIGHLWTVYRYTAVWRRRSLEQFTDEFLAAFPLERVVEIHVAGLGNHTPQIGTQRPADGQSGIPWWIDAHREPIPSLLFDMLQQVLKNERLINLKGMALEVDTKPIPEIVSEFRLFRNRFGRSFPRCIQFSTADNVVSSMRGQKAGNHLKPVTDDEKTRLFREYQRYALVMTGQLEPSMVCQWADTEINVEELTYYQRVYLPNEILHWGGELGDMFPHTNRLLNDAGIHPMEFVTFWFDRPRTHRTPYDFFLLKIEYFLEFVSATLPVAFSTASDEADSLRAGYDAANQRMNVTEIVR